MGQSVLNGGQFQVMGDYLRIQPFLQLMQSPDVVDVPMGGDDVPDRLAADARLGNIVQDPVHTAARPGIYQSRLLSSVHQVDAAIIRIG